MGRRRLQLNPQPLRIVPTAAREVWTGGPDYEPRCHHEDGRGQCVSRETRAFWNAEGRYIERYCARHEDEATGTPLGSRG